MRNIWLILIVFLSVNSVSAQEKKNDTRQTEHSKTVTTTTVQKRKVADKKTDASTAAEKEHFQTRTQNDGILTDDTAPGVHDPNNTGSVTPRTTDPAADQKVPVPVQPGATGNPNPPLPDGGNLTPR